MADISKFQVVIGADINGLQKSLGKVSSSLSSFGKKATSMGKNLSMSLTAPIVAFGALSLKEFAKVDKSLREVNTLFGLTGKEAEDSFNTMKKGVVDLSNELGIAQEVLSKGLYQAVSAGVPKDNVFEFMRVASQASVAGVTDVETAVDGLSTIINAFGLEATQAQAVADSMFTTVKGGKTDFTQLSSSLFNVAPIAAAMGVSFQEANAAIATLTAAGTPTSVAATQIRAAMTALAKPSEELTKIFQRAGFASGELALKQVGLQKTMAIVREAAGGSSAELTTLLGSVEAVSAVNVLAGTSAGKFSSEIEAQGKAAGSTNKAFQEMEKSASKQFEKLQVSIQNLGIEIGEALLPIVQKIVGWISKAVKFFSSFSAEAKGTAVAIAALVAGIGPAVAIIGSLATAIGFIISPIGLVVAGVAALTAAFVYAADNWDGIVERISDWSWWKNMLIEMLAFIIDYNPFGVIIKSVNAVLEFLDKEPIPDIFGTIADNLRELKGETKEYKNEMGSFGDAVGNAMSKVQKMMGFSGGGGGIGSTSSTASAGGQGIASAQKMGGGSFAAGLVAQEGSDNASGIKTPSIFGTAIEDAHVDLDSLNMKMESVMTNIEAQMQQMAEVANIIGGSVGDAFASLGHNIVDAMGLADHGVQGFLKSFLSSAVEIVANALSVATANAIMGASSAAAATGVAAPVTLPIFMAQMAGAVIAAFASIPKFANGGIVGGNSTSGDKVMARVNSGEMILNGAQQNNLFDMLNGGGMGGNVQFRIQGSDLIGTIDRENKRRGASL